MAGRQRDDASGETGRKVRGKTRGIWRGGNLSCQCLPQRRVTRGVSAWGKGENDTNHPRYFLAGWEMPRTKHPCGRLLPVLDLGKATQARGRHIFSATLFFVELCHLFLHLGHMPLCPTVVAPGTASPLHLHNADFNTFLLQNTPVYRILNCKFFGVGTCPMLCSLYPMHTDDTI